MKSLRAANSVRIRASIASASIETPVQLSNFFLFSPNLASPKHYGSFVYAYYFMSLFDNGTVRSSTSQSDDTNMEESIFGTWVLLRTALKNVPVREGQDLRNTSTALGNGCSLTAPGAWY